MSKRKRRDSIPIPDLKRWLKECSIAVVMAPAPARVSELLHALLASEEKAKNFGGSIVGFSHNLRSGAKKKTREPDRRCSCCFEEDQDLIQMRICGHRTMCQTCLYAHIQTKIHAQDVMPYIKCGAVDCGRAIHAQDIVDCQLPHKDMVTLVRLQLQKQLLQRETNWVLCQKCGYGGVSDLSTFYLEQAKAMQQQKKSKGAAAVSEVKGKHIVCESCQTPFPGAEPDKEFVQMIADGILRDCPKCKHFTMKEKGVCNVIQCLNCDIWWNWQTREFGRSSSELKSKARDEGTLWLPGELRYQMDLERNDPKEFKALLERSGVRYDPKYVRGT